jgi:hypothetical protein
MSVEGPSVDDVAAAVRGSLHGPPVDCRGLTAFGAVKARENAQARRIAEAVHGLYAPVLEKLEVQRHNLAVTMAENRRYQEALAWYAEESNYGMDGEPGREDVPGDDMASWFLDRGATARAALVEPKGQD